VITCTNICTSTGVMTYTKFCYPFSDGDNDNTPT